MVTEKAATPKVAKKKFANDMEALEALQALVEKTKKLIGEPVIVKKGLNADKPGVVKNILVEGQSVKVQVLLNGKSADDVFGWVNCLPKHLKITNPAKASLFSQYGNKVKSPSYAAKVQTNAACKAIRIAMAAGQKISAEMVAAVQTGANAWNVKPGAPVEKKEKKAKAAK